MTQRFFHTDPLAAAWMAKHFGMRFKLWKWNDLSFQFLPTGRNPDADSSRLYIHPESLHLLEPQDGDAVVFDRWHWERQRFDDMKDAPFQPHYATIRIDGDRKHIFSAGIGWDTARVGERFSLPFKIIQREGIAFHWPEVDAA